MQHFSLLNEERFKCPALHVKEVTSKCGFWIFFFFNFEEQTFNKKAQFPRPMKIIKKSRVGIDREEVNSMKTWKGRKNIHI